MKAVLLKGYGDVSQLEYGEAPEPEPGPGEVLVKVLATSVNPIDFKLRRGDMKDRMPLKFPAILGRDLAGEIVKGAGSFQAGDHVMGMVSHTYAEFLVAKAEELTLIPEGLAIEDAAALPLILITGAQLVEVGVQPKAGETVLVAGALGSVGRTAVHVAKQHGAFVIAGVRAKERKEAEELGADQVLSIDDDAEIAKQPPVDAIADTVGHDTIGKLLARLKLGGRLATVVGKPEAAEGRGVQVVEVWAKPEGKRLHALAIDVQQGKLKIPVARVLPLTHIGEAQQLAEGGRSGGKVVLVV